MAMKVCPKFKRVTIQRTLEHLRRGKIEIGEHVAAITMNTHIEGDNNLGARHFLFEHIPQLKFKNPHVKFQLFKQQDPDANLTIIHKNGDENHINCRSKSSSNILDEVKNICSSRLVNTE